jgi:predicted acylesterase/phospholipase RssA
MDSGLNIGLSLSGGGFRASIFHLGVIEALVEKNLLKYVTEVSGVSGGSIVAAHLVNNWIEYRYSRDRFDILSQPLLDLFRRNVRNRVLLLNAISQCVPFWNRKTDYWLEQEFKSVLNDTTFEFPKVVTVNDEEVTIPHLSILATSLNTGQIVSFQSDGVEFWPPADGRSNSSTYRKSRLSYAVTASAAFPLLCNPPVLQIEKLGVDNMHGNDHSLTDGGVFDNLGAYWLAVASSKREEVPLDFLIVSDGGVPFDWSRPAQTYGLISRARRANDLLMWRLAEYDTEYICKYVGEIFSIPICHQYPYDDTLGRCPNEHDQLLIRKCRTDLDAFSNYEIDSIRNHGRIAALDKIRGLQRWIEVSYG